MWHHMGGTDGIKLVVFDMDGVLVDFYSSWVWVHDHFGTCNDDSLESYMSGEIDDREFIRRDLALWFGKRPKIHISKIEDILKTIPLMKGIKRTISALKEIGMKCAILSGGLDILANRLRVEYCFDMAMSNALVLDNNGYLTGEGVVNVNLNDKATPLIEMQDSLGITPSECAAVGNSAIDVNMFHHSALGIAFNPDGPHVVKHSDLVVYKKDLTEILRYFG